MEGGITQSRCPTNVPCVGVDRLELGKSGLGEGRVRVSDVGNVVDAVEVPEGREGGREGGEKKSVTLLSNAIYKQGPSFAFSTTSALVVPPLLTASQPRRTHTGPPHGSDREFDPPLHLSHHRRHHCHPDRITSAY